MHKDDLIQLPFLFRIGVEHDLEQRLSLRIAGDRTACIYAVRSPFLFAHFLGVYDIQNLIEHAHQDLVLHVPLHVAGDCVEDRCFGVLHFTSENVLHFTRSE